MELILNATPAVLRGFVSHPLPLEAGEATLDGPSVPMGQIGDSVLIRIICYLAILLHSLRHSIHTWSIHGCAGGHDSKHCLKNLMVLTTILKTAGATHHVRRGRPHKRMALSRSISKSPNHLPLQGQILEIGRSLRHGYKHRKLHNNVPKWLPGKRSWVLAHKQVLKLLRAKDIHAHTSTRIHTHTPANMCVDTIYFSRRGSFLSFFPSLSLSLSL